MSAPPRRVLFRIVKGFIYGNVLGLFFAIAIYLLASAVSAIVTLPMAPSALALIIYSASVLAGVASEYSTWLEAHS
jgi:uncharacterized membrane protein YesL